MQRALSLASRRLQPVGLWGSCFSTSSACLQRGGRGQGRGGHYGNGAAQPRGPSDRPQGYGNRQQNYGNRQQGYGNSHQGYDNRQQGYDNHQQGSSDHSRQRGFGAGQRGGRGGGSGGRSSPRQRTDYTERDAMTLVQMKKAYKGSKHEKERMLIAREARALVRKTRIDMSSQDERTILTILNCASMFKVSGSEGVVQAVEWVLANLKGLSPHSIALFANALGVLRVERRTEIVLDEVLPLLPALMSELTPVEVIMVLQACQRLRIRSGDEVKDALLLQLEPCIATMPVPQLSTLAEVLCFHNLRHTDLERWQALVQAVMTRSLESVATMHSKEVLAFLDVVPAMKIPAEQIAALFTRATATAGFHTHAQIGGLLRALVRVQQNYPSPTPGLTAAADALQAALLVRLEKVALFTNPSGAADIWKFAALAGVQLPTVIQRALGEKVMDTLTHRKAYVATLRRLAMASAASKEMPKEVLDMVARLAVGIRPPRSMGANTPEQHHEEEDMSGDEDVEELRAATQETLYRRFFDEYVSLRLALEAGYANCGATPPVELTETLPQHLVQHIPETSPWALLSAAWAIVERPLGCPLRNVANDDAILAAVVRDIAENSDKYRSIVSPGYFTKLEKRFSGTERGAELLEAVRRAVGLGG